MTEPLAFTAVAIAGALLGVVLDAWIVRLTRSVGEAHLSSASDGLREADAAYVDRSSTASPRWQRPLVIAAASFVSVLAWWSYGFGPLLISRVAFNSALIVLLVVDVRQHRLPHAVTLPGIVFGVLASLFTAPGLTASLSGIVLGGVPLWLLGWIQYRLRGHVRLGMGDATMLAMIGAFLGGPLALVTLVLALCLGSVTSVALIAFRGAGLPPVLPFGTFLAVGGAIAASRGPALVDWYVGLW